MTQASQGFTLGLADEEGGRFGRGGDRGGAADLLQLRPSEVVPRGRATEEALAENVDDGAIGDLMGNESLVMQKADKSRRFGAIAATVADADRAMLAEILAHTARDARSD